MSRKSIYNADRISQVKAAGEKGLAVTAAAKTMGIHENTFSRWEAKYPAFKVAAQKVRQNSAAQALARYDKLLGKSEAQLMRALEWVRAQRAAEQARVNAAMEKMGYGKDWGPEALAARVRNVQELRREARTKERRRQKQQQAGLTISVTDYN